MRQLRSTCRVWNAYDLSDMDWTCHMDRVLDVYGGTWATVMGPVRIGRDTEYPGAQDLADAIREAFHLGAHEALAVAQNAFWSSDRDQAPVIQIKEERRNGTVEEVLLPILPWWVQAQGMGEYRMIQALNVTLAAAQAAEVESTEAERTSLPGYCL